MPKIYYFNTIDSTNDYIKRNQSKLEDRSIVVSKIQTKGRGRSNHKWNSDEGNLYFSMLVKKGIQTDFEDIVDVSVSLVKLLESYGINADIKYPNDILVNGKKIAGILIEKIYSDKLFEVIGIGLNVNQIDFGDLNPIATSIKQVVGKNFVLHDVLHDYINIYKDNHKIEEYIKKSIILGKDIMYLDEEYRVETIENDGKLVLVKDDYSIKVSLNEITLKEFYK